jgi:HSP20 family protein
MRSTLKLLVHAVAEATWRPSTDVYQTRDGWLIKMDLAGVQETDVKLSFNGGQLTVEGIRRDFLIDAGCVHYQMEIAYSRFRRTIELPCTLVSSALTSELRDGMLLIRVTSAQPHPAHSAQSTHPVQSERKKRRHSNGSI